MNIVNTESEYRYVRMMEDISVLQQTYPFLYVEYIGDSVMGKQIPVIRIGTGEKQIHYNGSFHANEWITSQLLMKFIEDYAKHVQLGVPFKRVDAGLVYRQTTLWIVPMVNPDGVELVHEGISPLHPFFKQLLEWNNGSFQFERWKANIRGVDLNDQFPAGWEREKERRSPTGPGPRDYVGVAPLTEPEAIAMAEFTKQHSFDLVIAFHTQGKEIYWNYHDMEPLESEEIARKFANVSGYEPIKLSESDAGYKDWFIQQFRKPGFTVEAGLGINPLPIRQFSEVYDEASSIMWVALQL